MHSLIPRSRGRVLINSSLMIALLVAMLFPWSEKSSANQQPSATSVLDADTSVVFDASADAHVTHSKPTENFGREETLVADLEPRSEVFIRFDVAVMGRPVTRATLRLWVTNPSSDVPELWISPHVSWAESELAWNTRPAVDDVVSNEEKVANKTWLEYDVTNAVGGDGSFTFALIPESNDGFAVNSREANDNQPELVIETGVPQSSASPSALADGEAVLLAAGDIAICGNENHEQTARILDGQPGTVAALGDTAYNEGTWEQFVECYDPTWGRHWDRTMPAVGNHEYLTEGASGYFDYFGQAAGDPDEGYYSYDLGEWHIVVLNSNIDMSEGSEQEQWLREDLLDHPVQCTLAYWHHARFSSGDEHGNNRNVAPLYQALYEHGAEVILTAHDHDYERFAPQNPDGEADPSHGIRQFVVGTGGAPLRGFGEIQPNSEVRNASVHGVLRLTLNLDSYEWEFLPVGGKSFSDSGSGSCHGIPSGGTLPGPSALAGPASPPTSLISEILGMAPFRGRPDDNLERRPRRSSSSVNRLVRRCSTGGDAAPLHWKPSPADSCRPWVPLLQSRGSYQHRK
ncbi:MAG: DNRLRE domain-containing protein [Chloroflexota bacterium]|nr:DNRLRE domain-containing protein [Chloroflexota bacterium]